MTSRHAPPGRALAALAASLALPGLAIAQSAEDLLAAHAEALGGVPALESVQTLRRTGTTRVETAYFDRFEGHAELAVVVGKKAYRHSDMGDFWTTSAWDGSRGWEQGPEGLRELTGDELRLLRQSAEPFRTAGVGLEQGARVSREADVAIGGVSHPVVSIEGADGSRLEVVLHPDTHLAIRVLQTADLPNLGPSELVTNLFDYSEHAGILLPSRVRTSIAGVFSAETVFETTQIDVELDPGLFEAPR